MLSDGNEIPNLIGKVVVSPNGLYLWEKDKRGPSVPDLCALQLLLRLPQSGMHL